MQNYGNNQIEMNRNFFFLDPFISWLGVEKKRFVPKTSLYAKRSAEGECAISPDNCPLPPLSFHKLGTALSTSLFIYLLTSALSFFMLITCF